MPLHLNRASLQRALDHALVHGDTDVLPPSFEFRAIAHSPGYLDELSTEDILQWKISPVRRCVSPKQALGFRPITQLDPLDFLICTALIIELGASIEVTRLPHDVVHSYRFVADPGDTNLYDPAFSFSSFRRAVKDSLDCEHYPFVVVTDISDFYPRVYHHRLKNNLDVMTGLTDHVKALVGILSQITEKDSHGIPVGPAFSRLLAEVTISDVDDLLSAEGLHFKRYMDDYVIFCDSLMEAHRNLARLAEYLFESHGLTLNAAKTKIVACSNYYAELSDRQDEDAEKAHLQDRWSEILADLGIDILYGAIELEDLDDVTRDHVVALNLSEILKSQLNAVDPDHALVRFVLSRMTQIQDPSGLGVVSMNIGAFHLSFAAAMRYLSSLSGHYQQTALKLAAESLLRALESTPQLNLEFHRAWAFSVLGAGHAWDNTESIMHLLQSEQGSIARRELMLAVSAAGVPSWFRSHKRGALGLPSWELRAFLKGCSSLGKDERDHWFRGIRGRVGRLDNWVMDWVIAGCP